MTGINKGFTLIETITALGIFSVFMGIVLSVYSHFTYSQRLDIGEQELQEDARLALEIMNREIRTGYGSTYRNPNDDTSRLSFVNQNGQCVFYELSEISTTLHSLRRAESGLPFSGCPEPDSNAFRSLTGPRTNILDLNFRVTPADFSGDLNQGFVTTSLDLSSLDKSGSSFRLQTTVTSRQFVTYENF